MRIKKLELLGFKSFKDKTVIHFDEGITGIVGPNGCGKSNIVDALVWVMGEMSAKHLRGSSMTDVIFAGAEGFAPLGMAEVSLTLENDGGPFPAKYLKHSEVMITRRLHRSGETEYLINKEQARLRDIQEIFMDTGAGAKGFSIIEQGRIGQIITAKPEQRRTLIEEVAGITKFKARKRESQRKLVSTDQNLVRLQDIIGEQKRQLSSLERQAQRAERYRKIKNELQDKEMWLNSKKYSEHKTERMELSGLFDEAKSVEASSGSDVSQLETDIEKLKLNITEKETELNEAQLAFNEHKNSIQAQENHIREVGFEIEQARRNKEMAGSVASQYQVRHDSLTTDKENFTEQVTELALESETLEATYLEKQKVFNEIQSVIRTSDDELTGKRREMLAVSQSISHLEAKESAFQAQGKEFAQRLEQQKETLTELKAKQEEFATHKKKIYQNLEQERQLQLSIMKDVDLFEENLNTVKNKFLTNKDELEVFKDRHNEVSSRLYGLENLHTNFEGFQEGVKSVMMWQKEKVQHADGSVTFQPVSEVVEVPAKYELSMEAALGERLQVLLSTDREMSLNAVDYLKEQKNGRSSFLTSNETAGNSNLDYSQILNEENVDSLLKDVVKVPEQYNDQIGYVLKDIVVVNDLRTALRLKGRYPNFSFVTLDGDTLSADGILTGGAKESADSGVLKRKREIKELSQQREEAAGKLALMTVTIQKLKSQFETMEEELVEAKKKGNEKEIKLVSLEKDLERAENELNQADRAVEKQQIEVTELEAKQEKLNEDLAIVLESKEENLAKKLELDNRILEVTTSFDQARNGFDEKQEEVTSLQVKSASKKQELQGLQHQLEMVTVSLNEVAQQLGQMSEESTKSLESMTENQRLLEENKIKLEKMIQESKVKEEELQVLRNDFEVSSNNAKEKETKISELLRARNEEQAKLNDYQLKIEQLKMKETLLVEQMHERYMVDLSEIYMQFANEPGDVDAIETDVTELRKKVNKIGEVNLSAIEEYDELSERYKFLSQQHEDLLNAKDQLRKVIDRINRICSRRFRETFEQVNERFVKVFPVLFGGGEAKLTLIEYAEKEEFGVDIEAKPPGKKLQNVSLLSGGEKALTAVSLIFSIFLVKPSPFCLLDEVDAPLDDANVFRFNDLVREMAKRSQIIVVTHNKHTMKVNNKIFGVTMESKGVSKLVSVNLDKAETLALA